MEIGDIFYDSYLEDISNEVNHPYHSESFFYCYSLYSYFHFATLAMIVIE